MYPSWGRCYENNAENCFFKWSKSLSNPRIFYLYYLVYCLLVLFLRQFLVRRCNNYSRNATISCNFIIWALVSPHLTDLSITGCKHFIPAKFKLPSKSRNLILTMSRILAGRRNLYPQS